MSRPRRRVRLGTSQRAFETFERRVLFCADHVASFAWTKPNDPASLAAGRQRIADLYDLTAPTSARALSAPAATGDANGLPILNSNPGAAVDIYLDFDGDAGTGVGSTHQMVTPYDTDGDPSTFDAVEANIVTQAWSLVSTYFAMFDVNVTTATPTRPFAWTAIGNNVTGGYSYIGVFPQALGTSPQSYASSEFARTRASGIAHEVGHNFGLQHQADFDALGRLTAEYSSGFDAQHGPIMGVDYAQRVRKWLFGHPSNDVLQLQDDMAVIADRIVQVTGLGEGYRPDDVGDTIATASPLLLNGVDQTRGGLLERDADRDIFSFFSTGGRYLVTANPDVESGADLKLEVFDATNRLLAAEDLPTNNDANLALNLPAGAYYARISSHGNYGDTGNYVVTVSPFADGTAFDGSDVGNVLRRAGAASFDVASGTWTLRGAGVDLSGATDGFRYVYQSLRGDGSITARVAALSGGGTFAKAGLMIRESLAVGARHATVDFRADGQAESLHRSNVGGFTTSVAGGAASAGVWLRLTRLGNTFTAERSADDVNWTTFDTATIAMNADVLIGMAVSSNAERLLASGAFDQLSVTGDVGPQVYLDNGLAAPADLSVAPTPTGSGLTVNWSPVAGAGSYVVERSVDGLNFAAVATIADTSHTDATLEGSYRYFYRVRALVGADASGRGMPAVASGVNRPSRVSTISTMSIAATQISIDWRDVVGETGYRIERSRDGVTWSVVDELPANHSGYVNFSLSGGANYWYRVTPLSDLGDGLTSEPVIEGSRFATVSGVRTTASSAHSLVVSWNDINRAETGYRIERSLDSQTWSTIANVNGETNSYFDASLLPFTTYYYRITATSAYTEGSAGGIGSGITLANPAEPEQAMPAGWGSVDVGTVNAAGASGLMGGKFRIVGSGLDVGGVADGFQFAYRHFTGDGELIARLDSIESLDAGAEVGLMFRESLAAGSRYAFASFVPSSPSSPTAGLHFDARSATNGNATSTTGVASGTPVWLRLVRSGDLFSGYRSIDGANWTLMGSATIGMGATIFVGLALSSHNLSRLAGATFANVGGTAAGQADLDPPAAPGINVSTDTGASDADGITRDTTLLLSGTAEPGAMLTLSQNGAALVTLVVGAAGTWSYAVPAVLGDGTYLFEARATDAAGNVSVAGTRTIVIDTASPTVAAAAFDREVGHRWTLAFDGDIGNSLTAADVTIVDRDTNATFAVVLLSYDPIMHIASFSLPANGLLPNGRYELRLAPASVTDLAGNDSGAAGYALPFSVLSADFDGDGTVGFSDLLVMAQHYGTSGHTFSFGNVDYDAAGLVDFNDLLLFARAYGTALPAGAAPAAQPTTARKRSAGVFSTMSI